MHLSKKEITLFLISLILHTLKYFKKTEIIKIMNQAGFNDVEIFRRHNYSWTIISKK